MAASGTGAGMPATALGLSIVRAMVEAIDGDFAPGSAEGVGTAATVALAVEAGEAVAFPVDNAPPTGPRVRVESLFPLVQDRSRVGLLDKEITDHTIEHRLVGGPEVAVATDAGGQEDVLHF